MDKKHQVLVVDDSDISRKELRQLIRREGVEALELHEAESGEAGVELYKNLGPFSYALVDVHLPGISGFGMLEKIRDLDPQGFSQMLVFMMCSDGPDSEHSHDASHHHDDACESLYASWLLKPVDVELLRRFLVSDARMRTLVGSGEGTALPQDSLRTLFEDSEHLTEKQLDALEHLLKSLSA